MPAIGRSPKSRLNTSACQQPERQRRSHLYGSVARSTCKDEEEVNASQNSRPGAKPLPKPPKLAPIETPPRYKHHGKNRTRVFGLRACRMSHAKNSSRRLFTVSAKSAIYRNIPQHTAPLTAPLKPPFPRRKHAREIAKPPKLKPAVNAPKKASVRLCTAFSVSRFGACVSGISKSFLR